MPKFVSLADYLGITDPARPESTPELPPEKLSPKQFCQAILNSAEFRSYILNGIILGELPPAVVLRIMDIGWGKPIDRVEHTGQDGRPIETITQVRRVVVHVSEHSSDDASSTLEPISSPKVTTH